MTEEQKEKRPRGRPRREDPPETPSKPRKLRGRPQKQVPRVPYRLLALDQAKRFAKARKLSGYSYYELSRRSGIQPTTIRQIEQGKLIRGVTTHTMSQLAEALGEDPCWLSFGKGTSLLAEKKKM